MMKPPDCEFFFHLIPPSRFPSFPTFLTTSGLIHNMPLLAKSSNIIKF